VDTDPVDVVRSVYDAFAAVDADRIADHLHADVELIDPDLPVAGPSAESTAYSSSFACGARGSASFMSTSNH
jgi:ketosteroid isomerase-like protein